MKILAMYALPTATPHHQGLLYVLVQKTIFGLQLRQLITLAQVEKKSSQIKLIFSLNVWVKFSHKRLPLGEALKIKHVLA